MSKCLYRRIAVFLLPLLLLAACQSSSDPATTGADPSSKRESLKNVVVPAFDADSAYLYVQQQVDFGPRYPGSAVQETVALWLKNELERHGAAVNVQQATVTVFDGTQVPMYNVIGTFNASAKERVVLMAHWDTRPFADKADDPDRQDEPILGANDGGSGVGVLLEAARQFGMQAPDVGVDIIFFDVEDYGKGAAETYCLGSQYWSRNPHRPGYKADYGILLDMVGAPNAVFYREGHSMTFAPKIVDKVWEAANRAGYSSYFSYDKVSPVTDDHYFVNRIAGIPSIDIIQFDPYTENGFGEFWHTHDDDMDVIDRNTLKAVGQTVLEVVYRE